MLPPGTPPVPSPCLPLAQQTACLGPPVLLQWGSVWVIPWNVHRRGSEVLVSTSSVYLSRKSPVLLLCSPDCNHCNPQLFWHQARLQCQQGSCVDSDIVHLETALDPTGGGPGPTSLHPPPWGHSPKSRLSPVPLTNQLQTWGSSQEPLLVVVNLNSQSSRKHFREFLGGTLISTPCFQWWGPGFSPWLKK